MFMCVCMCLSCCFLVLLFWGINGGGVEVVFLTDSSDADVLSMLLIIIIIYIYITNLVDGIPITPALDVTLLGVLVIFSVPLPI